jgi:hypothetical protein
MFRDFGSADDLPWFTRFALLTAAHKPVAQRRAT